MTDSVFVPHLTLDGILTLLALGGGAIGLYVGGVRKLDRVEAKVESHGDKLEEHGLKLDKLVDIAQVQARHDERLIELGKRFNTLDQRLDELRHGKGLVVD